SPSSATSLSTPLSSPISSCSLFLPFFSLTLLPSPRSTLFPYTTLFRSSTLLLIALLSAFSFILYFPLSNNGLHYLESNNLFSSCQINQAQELARHQNDAVRFITLQQASRSCHMGFLVLGAMG